MTDPTTQHDSDIMFNALFAIISDPEIDTIEKCMDVAGKALEELLDETRFDTPKVKEIK